MSGVCLDPPARSEFWVQGSGSAPFANRDVLGRSWRGRRVAVVGLGKSGQAALELLCRAGAVVRASDAHDTPALRRVQATWTRAEGVEEIELGAHAERIFKGVALVVVSPGVPESAAPIRWAQAAGIPIISEIELAFQFCRAPIVAVTGTNGKSTTVSLLRDVVTAGGRHAVACGNVGIPFSSVVGQLTPESLAVVEVSSFQLLWCHTFAPAIGVLLNLGVNHLDRHPDHAAYVAAKARLFQAQTPRDWAVVNGADAQVADIAERVAARRVWFGENRSNPPSLTLSPQTLAALSSCAQAVVQVSRLLGIPDPLSWQVIRSFRGLEHRLEHVATSRCGVRFINDSKSTTPESLLFALRQVRGEVVVILGGRDKGMDFRPLAGPLHEPRVKGLVLIGESRARLRQCLDGAAAHPPIRDTAHLEEALQMGHALAQTGTTVLFSPACASFDMFRDFEERGRRFKELVTRLVTGSPQPTADSERGSVC